MIVVDTSALFAIYAREAEADMFSRYLVSAERAVMGAPTAFEYRVVTFKRFGGRGSDDAALLLDRSPIEIVPFTPELVDIAVDALARFGGRPASLNYGDCMSYALAKSLDVPLLYKGGDFASTDVRAAV